MNDEKDTMPYPETLQLFDREDDAAVIAKLEGQVVEEYVYSFPQPNGTVYGIGINGAEACKRELAMTGEIIEEDDVKIESENADEARFQAKCSRWAVRKTDGLRIRLDSAIGLKRQPKHITRRNGELEANPYWYEQGGSKATRNAILHLTPKEIQRRIIQTYKGTKHEKKVVMTPEMGDAMTHEANASFKEKEAKDALVRKLKDRWRELDLSKGSVQAILIKKNLPKELASYESNWAGVDIAIVQDMLTEAGG